LPEAGTAFLSVHDGDKEGIFADRARALRLGFHLFATKGTAAALRAGGLLVETVLKVNEGRPNVVDRMINGDVHLIVNTPLGKESFYDEVAIRRTALDRDVPCLTTLSAAAAAVEAIRARAKGPFTVTPCRRPSPDRAPAERDRLRRDSPGRGAPDRHATGGDEGVRAGAHGGARHGRARGIVALPRSERPFPRGRRPASGRASPAGGRFVGFAMFLVIAVCVLGRRRLETCRATRSLSFRPPSRAWGVAFLSVAAVSALSSIVRAETLFLLLRGGARPLFVNDLWMSAGNRDRDAIGSS